MSYKLVTFDVTNTLLKFRMSPGQQYAKIANLYGVSKVDSNELTTAFKLHWKTLNVEHPNFGVNSGIKSSAQWWNILVGRTFESAGCPLDEAHLQGISKHLFWLYSTSICWDVRSGAKDVLRSLRERRDRQICIGVISNFDDRLHDVLKDTGLLPYFDFVLTSYGCRFRKPQAEIFHLALTKCKDCSPSDAVHIGDNLQLDYLGAKNAGWNAFCLIQDSVSDDFKNELLEEARLNNVSSASIVQDIADLVDQI